MKLKNWIKTHYIWSGIIGIFLFWIIISSFSGNSQNVTNNKFVYKINKLNACIMSQYIVKQKLISPITAKFPSCLNVKVDYFGNQTYQIYSYVDSENGYGAMIRNKYYIELKDNLNGNYKLKYIQFLK